jgi:tetratricopeptide (TPR) repeat protein
VPRFGVLWMVCMMLVGVQKTPAHAQNATELLRGDHFQKLETDYSALQLKFEQSKISSEKLLDEFRAFYPTDKDLAAKYDGWVSAFPRSYVARLARGIYYKKVGFEERGGDYISNTSDTKLEKMDAALSKATKDFGDSIPMTAKPFLSYFHMIDIGRAYVGPAETRRLYEQAVRLDPHSFDVRLKFMVALQTRWGGSLEQMQQFLEECRHASFPARQFQRLESMVYEDAGWSSENAGDPAAAELAYRKAIELDSADCTSCLVSSLTTILMKERKYADAIPFFDRYLKAKPGDSWALANRGLSYYQSGRPFEAFNDWTLSAAAGDAFSQNRLGVLYMTGIPGHVSPDPKQGIEWLRKAAEQGNPDAQRNLPIALSRSTAQGEALSK